MKTNTLRWSALVSGLFLAVAGNAGRADVLVYYNFNDAGNAAGVADGSGKGNDGVYVGAPTYTADGGGKSGGAGDRAIDLGAFNSGNYVNIPNAATGALDSVTSADAATISLWIQGNESQPSPQWTFYAGPGRQLGSHAPWDNGRIYFDVAGCCGATQRIDKAEPDASKFEVNWNHYAFVKNGTATAIYQNGVLWHDSGADAKAALGPITEFFLGAGPDGDRRTYNGRIDDFAIFNEALSAGRIADIAAGGPVIPEPASGLMLAVGFVGFALRFGRRSAR